MSGLRPFAFHLVENAVVKYQNMPSYAQIWGEVEAGRLIIDAAMCHDNKWILDAAIEARMKLTEGTKNLSENQGADPSMEKLWGKWASEAPSHVLGDADCQAKRAAQLITLGCADALEVLIKRGGLRPDNILQKWDGPLFTVSGKHPLIFGVNRDFVHTVNVLLRNGFSVESCGDNPFLKVKSAEMVIALLHHDVTDLHLKGDSLIDETFKRDLPAGHLEEIVLAFQEHGKFSETQDQKLARLAVNLGQKSNEQFQAEARIAEWSPSLNRQDFSPVQVWALDEVKKGLPVNSESGALAWFRKQSSHGRVVSGNRYSDAKLAWAVLLPGNRIAAETHAQIASDMPNESVFQRLKRYHDFLDDEDALSSGKFERAVLTSAASFCWGAVDENGLSVFLNECFDDNADKSWILWAIGDFQRNEWELSTLLEKSMNCGEGSKGLSLVLALSGPDPSPHMKSSIDKAWASGVRPFFLSQDWPRIEQMSRKMGGGFASQVQQWHLDQISNSAPFPPRKHRL